jgi:hypothetical protein
LSFLAPGFPQKAITVPDPVMEPPRARNVLTVEGLTAAFKEVDKIGK